MAVDVAATLALLAQWGYVILFVAAALESTPFAGVLVPGSAVVILAGALASQGQFSLVLVILLAGVASMVGDAVGYWLGARHGRGILLKVGARFAVTEKHLDRGEALFNKYGPAALVVARFNFITRGLAPFLAGTSRMTPWLFWFLNFAGSLVWAAAYGGVGFAFGASFLYLEGRIGRIVLVSLLSAGGIYLLYRWLRRHGAHFTRYDAALAAVGVIAAVLFGRLGNAILRGDAVALDGLRAGMVVALSPALPLFHFLTWLGDMEVALPVTAVLVAAFVLRRRGWDAALLGFAILGERVLVGLLKLAFHRARPDAGLVYETGYAFPSGHTTLSLVFCGTLVYVLARGRSRRFRLALSAVAVALAGGISISRIALGVHYPTDVLGGVLAGTVWLTVVLLLGEWIDKGPVRERQEARRAEEGAHHPPPRP